SQIPVLSISPRRCLLPPQIFRRMHPGTLAQRPYLPDRSCHHPSRCWLHVQNQTSPPAPPPCSNHPPALHQSHCALLPLVPSFLARIPPEICPAAIDPRNCGFFPQNSSPAAIRQT